MARLALAVLMFVVGWSAPSATWALALRVFALYPAVTAVAGWCPIYALLRFRTSR